MGLDFCPDACFLSSHVDEGLVAHDLLALVELALELRGDLVHLSLAEGGQALFHVQLKFENRLFLQQVKVGVPGQAFVAQAGVHFRHDGLSCSSFTALEFEFEALSPFFALGCMLGLQFFAKLCFTLVSEPSKTVLNLGFACFTVPFEILVGAGFELLFNLGAKGVFNLVNRFAVTEVEALTKPCLTVGKALCETFLELLLNFMPQLVTTSCDGQFHVLTHALFEVFGVLSKADLEFLLNFRSKVGFKPLTASGVLRTERRFTVAEALTDLLLEARTDAVPELLFTFCEHRFLFVLQPVNFKGFKGFVTRFHLLCDVVLKGPYASVEALVLLQLKALLGHLKSMFMLFLELQAKVMLNALLLLFHPSIGFHLVALAQHGHFTLEAHQMFVTQAALLARDGFSAFLGQFRFHRLTHFTLNLLQRALAFEFIAHHEVALLCENTLAEFLVTETTLTTHFATKTLLFVIASADVTFLFGAGAVGPSELPTQSREAATVGSVTGWPRMHHANPIPAAGPPLVPILVSSYIR